MQIKFDPAIFFSKNLSSNGFQKKNRSHTTITHRNLLKLTIALIVFQDISMEKKLPQSKPKPERPAKICWPEGWQCLDMNCIENVPCKLAKHFCFPWPFLKEVHKPCSLVNVVQNLLKYFRQLFTVNYYVIVLTMREFSVVLEYTELADKILRYFRNKHLCTARYWLFCGVCTLAVAQEKKRGANASSEEKNNLFRNLNSLDYRDWDIFAGWTVIWFLIGAVPVQLIKSFSYILTSKRERYEMTSNQRRKHDWTQSVETLFHGHFARFQIFLFRIILFCRPLFLSIRHFIFFMFWETPASSCTKK